MLLRTQHGLIDRYAASGPRLDVELARRLAQQPRCAATRFLLGCREFDARRPAHGARHFMIAYHADPELQSAALLAFTGLYWSCQPRRGLLDVVLDVWHDFRRPEFDVRRRERRLLDAFAEPAPDWPASALAVARFWRLPIAALRDALRRAASAADALTE